MNKQLPLVVVAGQVPPPTGGQNVMIQRIVDELGADPGWRTVHLPFFFTPSFKNVRKFSLGKIIELVAVWLRFLRLVRAHGKPDILLYPSGGPQTIPVVRDILLLPLFSKFSRRVVVQFHAAGIADRLAGGAGLIEKTLLRAYRGVSAAIVMTDFNRNDPAALGIEDIRVIPHRLPDENPGSMLPDYSAFLNPPSSIRNPHSASAPPSFNILYAGHLYDLKGTPQLIEAFGMLAADFPHVRLCLMGEFLPPYTEQDCRARISELGISDRVEITGVLREDSKARKFQGAHLFVFPSIAPYESFGLVMAEAMMWGLPVVATEWRGNRDVLGPDAPCVPVDSRLPIRLSDALRKMLADPSRLPGISLTARTRYEARFRLETGTSDYRSLLHQMLHL